MPAIRILTRALTPHVMAQIPENEAVFGFDSYIIHYIYRENYVRRTWIGRHLGIRPKNCLQRNFVHRKYLFKQEVWVSDSDTGFSKQNIKFQCVYDFVTRLPVNTNRLIYVFILMPGKMWTVNRNLRKLTTNRPICVWMAFAWNKEEIECQLEWISVIIYHIKVTYVFYFWWININWGNSKWMQSGLSDILSKWCCNLYHIIVNFIVKRIH